MQRLVGYVFLIAAGAAGVTALIDRLSAGSTLNPLVEDGPDWLGVVLVGAALGCGATLLIMGRPSRRERTRKEPTDGNP